jgi:hypothetical protein
MRFPSNTRGIARIVRPSPEEVGERHIGMAIIVDEYHVMTCCHVINDVLHRPKLHPERPAPDLLFSIRFPYAGDAEGVGNVIAWGLVPSRERRDVAVLRVVGAAPPDAGVAVFTEAEVQGEGWSCIGWDAVGITRQAKGNFGTILDRGERQLDGPTGIAARIAPGYSGSGVWCDAREALGGMVVTEDREKHETGLAFAIPTGVLLASWPGLRLARDDRPPDRGPIVARAGLAGLAKRLADPAATDRDKHHLYVKCGSSGTRSGPSDRSL